MLLFYWLFILFIFKFSHGDQFYTKLGLTFPEESTKDAVGRIRAFSNRNFHHLKKIFTSAKIFLSWFAGFVLMWLVVLNMGVSPFKNLYFAIILSLLEIFLAIFIIMKLSKNKK